MALAIGCRAGPPPLEIVPAESPQESPLPPRYALELRTQGEAPLWLPLPPHEPSQQIDSLFWVVPEGDCELVEAEGQRALRAPRGTPIELRVRFALPERALPELAAPLAERLAGLPNSDSDFVGEAGALARERHGLVWGAGAQVAREAWVEVHVDGAWWVYDCRARVLVPHGLRLALGGAEPSRGIEAAAIRITSEPSGTSPGDAPKASAKDAAGSARPAGGAGERGS